ncbi:hypothetical protein [Cohnella cellulosilytica]|uniref:TubC N-terminal docking domain-containing protein n=1 Tax=Cohnella cellulosilytica TaxID=986710 RepID=A0ABW2FC92_9BACL
MDFTFEILDSSTINIRFNYGGAWFEFNLFYEREQWILHPYDASLLGNPEMCRLVIADLLANKTFQVMLAKERILLSQLRTSVDVSGDRYERIPSERSGRENEREPERGAGDEIDRWVQQHTFKEIVDQERQRLESRLQLYQTLLQKMFYQNLGPGDDEFDKVQEITRIYKDAIGRLDGLADRDDGGDFKDDLSKGRRF